MFGEIAFACEQTPWRRRECSLDQVGIGQWGGVAADGDVIVFADDVDGAVRRMGDDIDLGIEAQEVGNHVRHGEVHGG